MICLAHKNPDRPGSSATTTTNPTSPSATCRRDSTSWQDPPNPRLLTGPANRGATLGQDDQVPGGRGRRDARVRRHRAGAHHRRRSPDAHSRWHLRTARNAGRHPNGQRTKFAVKLNSGRRASRARCGKVPRCMTAASAASHRRSSAVMRSPLTIINTRSAEQRRPSTNPKQRKVPAEGPSIIYEVPKASTARVRGVDPLGKPSSKRWR